MASLPFASPNAMSAASCCFTALLITGCVSLTLTHGHGQVQLHEQEYHHVHAHRRVQQQDEEGESLVHPGLYCDPNYDPPCGLAYFCNYESGEIQDSICEPCPAFPAEQTCLTAVNNSAGVEDCLFMCVRGQEGDPCNATQPCQEARYFCNYEFGDSGVCEACKSDESLCVLDGTLSSELGQQDCLWCDLKCWGLDYSNVTIHTETNSSRITSLTLSGSPSLVASGPIVDCTNLIHDDQEICSGANHSVCLVEDYTKNTLYFRVVHKCEASGGIGVLFFGDYDPRFPNDQPFSGYLSFKETSIPSVAISYNDGKKLQENRYSKTNATISVTTVGDLCWTEQTCSETIPCVGQWGNNVGYCGFGWGGDEGHCIPCPVDEEAGEPDPYACFFDKSHDGSGGRVIGQKGVESCAANCASSLKFGDCKFCPKGVNGFSFGVEDESERCRFCPENDVQYPEREFPLFGDGIMCWQVQKFFDTVEVHDDSENCRLAQMFNYLCGCEGPGYAGADSRTKQAVLAWLPRAMAILSFLGSAFIIIDASRDKKKREKVSYQLLITLSVFDILGSFAYALTTLPIPENQFIFGSKGNDATCVAQGFFIQLGTISCYTNVSLAVYYMFIIKMGMSEHQVKKLRVWLFAGPIVVGLAFAFAGIPFYGNMILWCNNTASWWPEIPVAVAIFVATLIMITVCVDVYRKEKASLRWRRGGDGAQNKLSTRVLWQSFWYLMAFFLTWPVYLALQYSWASGKYFSNYGFTLAAGTMVPLQGFWNFFVYIRPRYLKDIGSSVQQMTSKFLSLPFSRATSEATSDNPNSSGSGNRNSSGSQTSTMMSQVQGASSKNESEEMILSA